MSPISVLIAPSTIEKGNNSKTFNQDLKMDLNLLLELKFHVEQDNLEEAIRVSKILAEEHLSKEHPDLKVWDNMLYLEVIHLSAPLMIERVKKIIANSSKLAS
jgi:hypothetical protein